MIKCLNCGSVFDENETVEIVLDHHAYGEGYAAEYGCACPHCGSTEITEAFQCSCCGEYFPAEQKHWHPIEETELCDDCLFAIEHAYETNPYLDIINPFDIAKTMIILGA